MLERIEARLAATAARRRDQAARRLADALRHEMPGLTVAEEGERIVISGRALWRRLFDDARLRWIAGWFR